MDAKTAASSSKIAGGYSVWSFYETYCGFPAVIRIKYCRVATGQCSTGEQKYRRKWTRGSQSGEAAAKVQQKGGEKTAQSDEEIPESAEEGEQEIATPSQIVFAFLQSTRA